MKILTINSALNGSAEEMNLIMDSFLQGLQDSGAEVEVFNANYMNILPCRACTDKIDFETDGKCQCEDDMQDLYPKLKESDVWVFASTMTDSALSNDIVNILDRLEPLFQPDTQSITRKYQSNRGKVVFIGTTKDHDSSSFNDAVSHMKSVSKIFNRDYAGSVLRPHSWAMKSLKSVGSQTDDILIAAREAGQQLVRKGRISQEVQKKVSRDIIPKKSFSNKLSKLINI